MHIGMTIPFMEPGWQREAMKLWATEIDRGPWASVAMGERITFVNPEFMTSLAATAAWYCLTDQPDKELRWTLTNACRNCT